MSIERIAELLGHADSKTTYKNYVRFTPDFLRDAAEVLEIGAVRDVRGTVTG